MFIHFFSVFLYLCVVCFFLLKDKRHFKKMYKCFRINETSCCPGQRWDILQHKCIRKYIYKTINQNGKRYQSFPTALVCLQIALYIYESSVFRLNTVIHIGFLWDNCDGKIKRHLFEANHGIDIITFFDMNFTAYHFFRWQIWWY